ncbi:MAG: hypothetical protein E6L09_02090 [Verrucomicrobia bacterium]|nr:MAG: hypothetical protein E6L09_02090 [Verrucomicrobiota bacterium]
MPSCRTPPWPGRRQSLADLQSAIQQISNRRYAKQMRLSALRPRDT